MIKYVLAAVLALSATTATAEEATFKTESLTPETALKLATATLEACRNDGYQIAVSVVDRSGIEQVMLRDRFAGPHTVEMAKRKAWTAVTFRTNTTDLMGVTQAGMPQSAIRHLPGVIAAGGGIMVRSGEGSLLGGIGVSGAPGGDLDDVCAEKGIAAIEDLIAF